MATGRPVLGVGEIIYPRQGLPPCRLCHHEGGLHRYTVVDTTRMKASGCDGDNGCLCACERYVGPDAPPTREETWARYPDDAMSILDEATSPTAICRQPGCRRLIWWGVTKANQRRCPFDVRTGSGARTGTSHWRTCEDPPARRPDAAKRRN